MTGKILIRVRLYNKTLGRCSRRRGAFTPQGFSNTQEFRLFLEHFRMKTLAGNIRELWVHTTTKGAQDGGGILTQGTFGLGLAFCS